MSSDSPDVAPTPACTACGACCFALGETYARVTGADWTRLGLEADTWAQFIGHRAYLRIEQGRCRALDVQRDEDGARRYLCRIYERRPQICRDLERGSPACEAERIRKADRSLAPAGTTPPSG